MGINTTFKYINDIKTQFKNQDTRILAKKRIKALNTDQRKCLLKILKHPDVKLKAQEIKDLNLAFSKKPSKKTRSEKLKGLWDRVFHKRPSAKEILNNIESFKRPYLTQKELPASESSSLGQLLPLDIREKIIHEIEIKNRRDIKHCIDMMKALCRTEDKSKRILGGIDIDVLARWMNKNQISLFDLPLSDTENKALFPKLSYLKLTDYWLAKLATSKIKLGSGCTHLDLRGCKKLEINLKTLPRLTSLDLSGCKLPEKFLINLKKPSILTSLNLSRCSITIDDLQAIGKLTGLKTLNLANTYLIDKDLIAILGQLTSLTSLNLSGRKTTTEGLKEIVKLPALTSFSFGKKNITDEDLKEITKLTSLTTFGIFGNLNQPHNTVYDEITKFSALTSLSLGLKTTDQDLEKLAQLTSLTHLDLYSDDVTDKGLRALTKIPLVSLSIYGNRTKLTDKSLREIAKITSLTSLEIKIRKGSSEGFKKLSQLTNLTSFTLSGKITTDAVLKEIAKLTKLTKLRLWDADKVTPEGFKTIAKMGHLESLTVLSNTLTDRGLKEITKMHNLSSLSLLGPEKITSEGFEGVAKMRSLSYLGLSGYINTIAKETLEIMPKHIEIDPNCPL